MTDIDLLSRLAQPADSRIVLLVLDGLGDIRTEEQPQTALEKAVTPNLDRLAERSALGRLIPASHGVTPGSGPGHLALFGYDPTSPQADIGRGVLEALGLGLEIAPGEVAVRGNFATADDEGRLTDRRAGRIPTEECRRLCGVLQTALEDLEGMDIEVAAGEAHRFVLILRGDGLSPAMADTDPQRIGVPPLSPAATTPEAQPTVERIGRAISLMEDAIRHEPQANRVLFRGFSALPALPSLGDLYSMRCGAFAGYPLYRGVAAVCGMETVPCGKRFADLLPILRDRWQDFDFFFLHVKQTDMAGEDGDLETKAAVLEEVDRDLPELLKLGPDVLAITGDHATPAPLSAHSWHPSPLLLHSPVCHVDPCREFTEDAAVLGHLGTLQAHHLMGLLLANAGRLAKFGA